MSEVDLTENIVQRGTTYILVYAFLSDVFRYGCFSNDRLRISSVDS